MEKLTWTDLRRAVAEHLSADEKEVGTFLNALVPAITKALQEDRQVRISNLGTFKLQAIAPRKSVNVATGEPFILPGYDKLNFIPEASVKERISDTPSNILLKEGDLPMRKLGEQADEIVSLLGDLGQSPKAIEETESEIEKEETSQDEIQHQEEMTEQPKEEVKSEDSRWEEIKKEQIRQEQVKQKILLQMKTEKTNRTWLIVGITVLIFAALLTGAFLFVGNQFIQWVESLSEKNNPTAVITTDAEVNSIGATSDELLNESMSATSTLPYPFEYKEFIAQEYLPQGSRLAWLARKYYNERDLWVFIYEANRNTVQHPSQIQIGTLIRIPKLPKELRDFSNPELRQLIDRLEEEYKQL